MSMDNNGHEREHGHGHRHGHDNGKDITERKKDYIT